jgi:hypothetical protein
MGSSLRETARAAMRRLDASKGRIKPKEGRQCLRLATGGNMAYSSVEKHL